MVIVGQMKVFGDFCRVLEWGTTITERKVGGLVCMGEIRKGSLILCEIV